MCSALPQRGEVFGFGSCAYGALGRAPSADVTKLPVRVPLGVAVRQIAAGYDHALAVCTDGKVLSWGSAGVLPPEAPCEAPPPPPVDLTDATAGGAADGDGGGGVSRHAREGQDSTADGGAREGPPAAAAVGQLGRRVERAGEHTGAEAAGWAALPSAYSSSPAPATALGPCELVAAGSFCSMGLPLGPPERSRLQAGAVEVVVRGGTRFVMAVSAPPA